MINSPDRKNHRTTRPHSWTTPPKPPVSYAGPAHFGYPQGRYSRTEELEARIRRIETALASAGLPCPGDGATR